MLMNMLSLPLLIYFEPFWIWMPLITILVSPLLGGSYCMFNQLENVYRKKAGLSEIEDRLVDLFKGKF